MSQLLHSHQKENAQLPGLLLFLFISFFLPEAAFAQITSLTITSPTEANPLKMATTASPKLVTVNFQFSASNPDKDIAVSTIVAPAGVIVDAPPIPANSFEANTLTNHAVTVSLPHGIAPGNYIVRITLTQEAAVPGETPIIEGFSQLNALIIYIPPTATLSGGEPVCSGSSSDLRVDLTGKAPWSITYTDGTTPRTIADIRTSPLSIPVSPSSTSTYFLTNVSDAYDIGTTSGSAAVTVKPVPDAPTASSNSPVDSDGTLTLHASAIENATYRWSGPNNFTSTAQNPTVPNVTPAASGTYSVTATVNGCTSLAGTVVVAVRTLNNAPEVTRATGNVEVNEDAANTVIDLGTTFSDMDGDDLTIVLSGNNNPSLIAATYDAASRKLTLDYGADGNGTAAIRVKATDAEGLFAEDEFTVTVHAVNDAPSFVKGANQAVDEDAPAQSVAGWASSIAKGPADESTQIIGFVVSNDNNSLFSNQPAVAANGTLTFTPAANASGEAVVSVKLKDNGGTANGGVDASGTQTFTITLNAVNDAPVVTNNTPNQHVQYSDPIAPVTVTATDVDNTFSDLTATASWKPVSAGAFTPGLENTGLTLTRETDTWSLSGKAMLAPGNYVVRVDIQDGTSNARNNTGYTEFEIVVNPENATLTYSGLSYFSTSGPTSCTATVTLSATVADHADASTGDIRNARVTFHSGSITGPVLGISNLTPVLINSSDPAVGTVSTSFTYTLSSADCANKGTTLEVYAVVEASYTGNNNADPGSVTVSVPGSDAVTGGGYLLMTNSIGAYAGTNGTKTNFGFTMKFTKNGGSAKGQCNIIIRSNNRVYKIKSNAINSLGTKGQYGNISTKATLTDITNPLSPITISGNLDLLVDMYDVSNSGKGDELSISLKSGSTILYSSNWYGSKTSRKELGGGIVQVKNATTTSVAALRVASEIEVAEPVEQASFKTYPNPFRENATIEFSLNHEEEYSLSVYSVRGSLVRALQSGKAQAKKAVQVTWGDASTPAGVYILRLTTRSGVQNLRIVRE